VTREEEFELALAQRERQADAESIRLHRRYLVESGAPVRKAERINAILDALATTRRHPEVRA
jgi:hypothetical protein